VDAGGPAKEAGTAGPQGAAGRDIEITRIVQFLDKRTKIEVKDVFMHLELGKFA
jgi:hypothetical protein